MTTKLKDVAIRAGVSPATVSVVLNQNRSNVRISDATRERVVQAAQELNYSPNPSARQLRTKKTYTIGIVSFDTNDPIANTLTSSFDRLLVNLGYRTVISDAQNDSKRAMKHIQYFADAKTDGLILLPCSYTPDKKLLQKLQTESQIRIISVLRDLSAQGIQSFVVDYRNGAKEATRHLLDTGRKKIAVILGPDIYRPDNSDRLEGVLEALAERKLELDHRHIVKEKVGGWDPSVGFHSMNQLLARNPRPDAVIAFDDVTAFGGIRAIYDKDLRVPEDLAIVGFDDLLVSAYYNPPLTTVKYPIDELASAAIMHLAQSLKGEIENSPRSVSFESTLIVRKSTNPTG